MTIASEEKCLALGDIINFQVFENGKTVLLSITKASGKGHTFSNGDRKILIDFLPSKGEMYQIARLMCEAAGLSTVEFFEGINTNWVFYKIVR